MDSPDWGVDSTQGCTTTSTWLLEGEVGKIHQGLGTQMMEVATPIRDLTIVGDLQTTDSPADRIEVGLHPHQQMGQKVDMEGVGMTVEMAEGEAVGQEITAVVWVTDFATPGLTTGVRFHPTTQGSE